jgi:hypothetical protein
MSDKIVKFLEHPCINQAAVMRMAGINPTYWARIKKDPSRITVEKQEAILKVIEPFGFKF